MRDPRVGVAQRSATGESICGDSYAVVAVDKTITVALADGLGHGPLAAKASTAFCDFVRENVASDLEEIVRGAHSALNLTRGAAVALARIDWGAATLEFTGVGNVELRAHSKRRIAPACVPGIVGSRLRRTTLYRYAIEPSDLFVLHTDGIVGLNDLAPFGGLVPQRTAELILASFVGSDDDATCIAIRTGRGAL